MLPTERQELRERISKQSDKDLLKIVNVDFKDYRKEAIEFARVEIEKRGLSHRLIASPKTPRALPQEEIKKQVELSPKEETIKCRFCGSVISTTDTECGNCGYGTPYGVRLIEEQLLEEASAKSVITLINCPVCSSEISNQAVACPKCGQPIKEPQPIRSSTSSNFISPNRASGSTLGKIPDRSDSLSPQGFQRRKAGRLVVFGALTAVISALAFLWGYSYTSNLRNAAYAGISSSPSESDARQVLEARSGGLYKITSFHKTNGQASETSGVKGYRLEYEADAECRKVNWDSPYPPLRDDFAGGLQCTRVGEIHKMRGTITFQQTENGWKPVDF
jgi:hypothetical protein